MTLRVVGLVLAAGAGRRFGGPKALVQVAGERLVDRAVATLRAGGCGQVYVVAGAAPLDVPGATVVENPAWATGMGSSLRVGLQALPPTADAAVVALVDQPWIGAEVVRRLVTAAAGGAQVVVAAYDGARRNPVLLARAWWDEAQRHASGDVGARAFLEARPDLVTTVECRDVADARDIDRRSDLPEHLPPAEDHH